MRHRHTLSVLPLLSLALSAGALAQDGVARDPASAAPAATAPKPDGAEPHASGHDHGAGHDHASGHDHGAGHDHASGHGHDHGAGHDHASGHGHDHGAGHDHGDEMRGAGAHVHGAIDLTATLEGEVLTVSISGAMANFLPFERAPADDAERAAYAGATQALRAAETLVVPAEAAQCTIRGAEIQEPGIIGAQAPAPGQDIHTAEWLNMGARWSWTCADPVALNELALPLFTRFPAIERVTAAFLGDTQTGAEVTPAAPTFRLRP